MKIYKKKIFSNFMRKCAVEINLELILIILKNFQFDIQNNKRLILKFLLTPYQKTSDFIIK